MVRASSFHLNERGTDVTLSEAEATLHVMRDGTQEKYRLVRLSASEWGVEVRTGERSWRILTDDEVENIVVGC